MHPVLARIFAQRQVSQAEGIKQEEVVVPESSSADFSLSPQATPAKLLKRLVRGSAPPSNPAKPKSGDQGGKSRPVSDKQEAAPASAQPGSAKKPRQSSKAGRARGVTGASPAGNAVQRAGPEKPGQKATAQSSGPRSNIQAKQSQAKLDHQEELATPLPQGAKSQGGGKSIAGGTTKSKQKPLCSKVRAAPKKAEWPASQEAKAQEVEEDPPLEPADQATKPKTRASSHAAVGPPPEAAKPAPKVKPVVKTEPLEPWGNLVCIYNSLCFFHASVP